MPDFIVQLLLVPLLVQSLGGYLWLAAHLRRRHGFVRPEVLGPPDLVVFGILGFFLLQMGLLAMMKKVPLNEAVSPTPVQILVTPLLFLAIGVMILGFLVSRRISLVELFGLRRVPLKRVPLLALGMIFLAMPAIFSISQLVMQVLEHMVRKELTEEQLLVALFRSDVQRREYVRIASLLVATVVLAPLGEELLFRGYFYPVGKRYFGAVGSAMATAVLFALLHLNVASFAGLLVLALCLTLAFEYTGSLLVPMAMHAIFNATSLASLVYEALHKQP